MTAIFNLIYLIIFYVTTVDLYFGRRFGENDIFKFRISIVIIVSAISPITENSKLPGDILFF